MKWIKASDRLPEKDGQYFTRSVEGWGVSHFIKDSPDGNGLEPDEIWLDESEEPSSQPSVPTEAASGCLSWIKASEPPTDTDTILMLREKGDAVLGWYRNRFQDKKAYYDDITHWMKITHPDELASNPPTATPEAAKEQGEVKTKIISAFPGTGKSWFVKHSGLNCLDSDSSTFDKSRFPWNYIEHIEENIGKYDYIFVSSHAMVRDALYQSKIPFICAYPDMSCKKEYISRYKQRGNDEKFISLIGTNWQDWIEDLDSAPNFPTIRLTKGLYLSDILAFQSTTTLPASTALNDGWISVEERLPEDVYGEDAMPESYLVYNPDNWAGIVYRVSIRENKIWFGGDKSDDVTHWQPLPTPPKK